jgi:hypothetical protein
MDFESKLKDSFKVWKSIKFDGIWFEPQYLVIFEQDAPTFTSIMDQLKKTNLEIQICDFFDLFKKN